MLTRDDLGAIEQVLDSCKLPSGAYRDGWRDCLKTLIACTRDEGFIAACHQMFFEAMVKELVRPMTPQMRANFEGNPKGEDGLHE